MRPLTNKGIVDPQVLTLVSSPWHQMDQMDTWWCSATSHLAPFSSCPCCSLCLGWCLVVACEAVQANAQWQDCLSQTKSNALDILSH